MRSKGAAFAMSIALGLFCLGGAFTLILAISGCGGSTGGGVQPPPQKPTASITASPTSITDGASSTLTWSSTNATSCTASGAWNGTQPINGILAVSPTATATYTIACTGAGGSATASATVTVTAVVVITPNVTEISPNVISGDISNGIFPITLTGSDFLSTDVVNPAPFNNVVFWQLPSSTEIVLHVGFAANGYSPGWWTYPVCGNSNDTNCGTSPTLALLGARNYQAVAPSGELFLLDQVQSGSVTAENGYVRKYKSDGTADPDGDFFVNTSSSIAIDDKTGNILIDDFDYNEKGGTTDVAIAANLPSSQPVMAVAARNGYGCFTQPGNNSASCYPLTGTDIVSVVTASGLGSQPEPIAMATFGGETEAFVVSMDGTSSLYQVRAADAYAGEKKALPLPGVTSISTVQAKNPVAGGMQVIVFDSGSASGTIAVLSTYDQLLLLINVSTWTVTHSVPLPCATPFRIATDVADGNIVVACADPADVMTTYLAVSASSGAVTTRKSTSPLLSVGLGISSDGKTIRSSQRNQMDLQQNQ